MLHYFSKILKVIWSGHGGESNVTWASEQIRGRVQSITHKTELVVWMDFAWEGNEDGRYPMEHPVVEKGVLKIKNNNI